MDEFTSRVSLKKPEPWTDPVTGEIYPGGMPSTAAQPSPQPTVQSYAQPAAQPAAPKKDALDWDDEPVSRPKFDFDNLEFGMKNKKD